MYHCPRSRASDRAVGDAVAVSRVSVAAGCIILEPHVLFHVQKPGFTGRAIALLRDNNVDQRVIVAMKQHHRVGVLLDGAGLAQVAQLRLAVLPVLDLAIELRETKHGDVEFPGKQLQPARHGCDLLLAVVPPTVRLGQLQVIDHHETDAVTALHAADVCCDLDDGLRFVVVYEEGRTAQRFAGLHDALGLGLSQSSAAKSPQIDARHAGKDSLGKLGALLLQADEKHGGSLVNRDVDGNVGRERGFPDARTGGEHGKFGTAQTGGQGVEFGKTRWYAAESCIALGTALVECPVNLLHRDVDAWRFVDVGARGDCAHDALGGRHFLDGRRRGIGGKDPFVQRR